MDINKIKPPNKCNIDECEELMWFFLSHNCINAVENYRRRIDEILEFNNTILLNRNDSDEQARI